MVPVLSLVAAAIPPDDTVGPGVGGFLAIFALALATVLLIRSMVGHLRKVRYGPGPGDEDAAPAEPPATAETRDTAETEHGAHRAEGDGADGGPGQL